MSIISERVLHEEFLTILYDTRLIKDRVLLININYYSEESEQDEVRCIFYDVKSPENFLKSIERRMEGVIYNTVRASHKRILVKDQHDIYGAFIQHALDNSDRRSVMDIYLTSEDI